MVKVNRFKLSVMSIAVVLAACGGSGDLSLSQPQIPDMRTALHQTEQMPIEPMVGASNLPAYTPAQIRAAYDMVPLPADMTNLTPAQKASFGNGQTIYIAGFYYNNNTASDLATFNAKYNLPTCTTSTLNSKTKLPLEPASSGCSLVVAYSTSTGTLTDTVPTFNSTWASEAALDIQWAHAIAPLARIVFVTGSSNSGGALVGDVLLANAMGPGIVSMSFGAPEGAYVQSFDSYFKTPNMTYVAAAGDSGAAVNWPAVATNVLSVGGTWLNYSNSTRIELAWNLSSGGVSSYMPKPAYQKNINAKMRTVPDVAFNASPQSGQYVYMTTQGQTKGFWYALYGTSAGAPQWAGILAIVNAQRALNGKSLVGVPNTALYQTYNANSTYATNFYDVSSGADGTCATCTATIGFDFVTGLGSPNVNNLLTTLMN